MLKESYRDIDFALDPSLVLYIPCPPTDGGKFQSRDRLGHPCTVNGAIWTQHGYKFDGSDDSISVADSPPLNITSTITVMAVVNMTTLTDYPRILRKANTTYSLHKEGANWRMDINVGVTEYTALSTTAVIANRWCFVVGTYDGSNVNIYIDSRLEKQTPSSGSINVSAADIDIGVSPAFTGLIGDILLYNRALTQLEISNIWQSLKWRYPI